MQLAGMVIAGGGGGSSSAGDVSADGPLQATTVQEALDALGARLPAKGSGTYESDGSAYGQVVDLGEVPVNHKLSVIARVSGGYLTDPLAYASTWEYRATVRRGTGSVQSPQETYDTTGSTGTMAGGAIRTSIDGSNHAILEIKTTYVGTVTYDYEVISVSLVELS